MPHIYPSLIAADPLHVYDTIKKLEPYCAGFHCDIMDNHFVPNLTFGADTANAIDAATKKPSWVHLMVDSPLAWCKKLKLKANSIVSFHIESTKEIKETIQHIKKNSWRASIAIKPKTDIEEVFPFAHLIDQVLIMSVEPGFSGQHFLESTIAKIAPFITFCKKHALSCEIGMDGGITEQNIAKLAQEGVQDFALASAIFKADDPVAAVQQLAKIVQT